MDGGADTQTPEFPDKGLPPTEAPGTEPSDTTLSFLTSRLTGANLRRGGLALGLWGAAGIGKTHTTLEALRQLSCRSLSLPASVSLGELERRLPRPARLPQWAGQVLDRIREGQAPESQGALLDALAAVLGGLAPFVLHLEDLHEADADRRGLIQGLARLVLRSRGVGLLVTSRSPLPEEFEARHQGPHAAADSARLLQTEAGAPLPADALAWIFGRASGNPLFTLEYFRLLARLGHLWNDARQWRWRPPLAGLMPVTVEALIERALQEVTGPLAEVAGAMAMLPAEEDAERLLAAVTGLVPAALRQAQEDLARRGVLFQGRFVHPLYREVTLRNLDSPRRRGLARRAMAALEGEPELAAGFVESAELPAAEASALLERAAASAQAAGRTASAARLLAQAADLAGGDAQAGLALRAARALETINPAEALRLARVAAERRPGDPETALYLAGRLVQRSRRLADADEVLAPLPQGVRLGRDWTQWQISWLMSSGQYAGALDLWDAHPELHALPEAATLYSVAASLAQTGQFEGAAAMARRGLGLDGVTPARRASLLNVSSMACAFMGQPEAAEAHLDEALALAREHGLHQMLGALLQNRSKNLERTDRFADALAAAQEAFRAYGDAGDSLRHANAGVLVGAHLTEFGRYQEAETLLLDSLALLERQGPSRFLVVAQTTLAGLYRDWQPPHGQVLALKLAKAALEQARLLGPVSSITVFALSSLARSEAAFGDARAAHEHAREAAGAGGAAPDESAFMAQAALAAAHAALGERAPAREALRAALAAASERGFGLDVRRLRLELARLDGDLGSAREQQEWFAARGLLNGVALARRMFPGAPAAAGERAQEAAPAALPRLEVLGAMRFGPAGAAWPVRGRKRRELLATLLDAQLRDRAEVTRLELLDALYPEVNEAQASASLKELVHLTRGALGAGVIQTTGGGYALAGVESDAALFLKTGDTRLWRGSYLQDALPAVRDETVGEALHLSLRLQTAAATVTDPPEAARTARLLLEAEPYDLEVLALALAALRASGNHRSLHRRYQEARLRLAEVGEALPEHWAEFMSTREPSGRTPGSPDRRITTPPAS